MAGNYNLYAKGILNQFSTYSVAHVTTGAITVATATVTAGGAYVNDSGKCGGLYTAYKVLWARLNDGQTDLITPLTTTEIDALSGIDDGVQVIDKTLGRMKICVGGIFKSPSTETNTIAITASTTQTQAGATVLTSEMNFVETVANENDAVKLQSVSNGIQQTVINDGDNSLQIFPFLGDNLGNGVNQSMHLEPHEEITFWGKDSTNWHIRHITENFHCSMYEQDNSTEFVIHAVNEQHAYHSANMVVGNLAEWTFNAGSAGASVTITTIANDSGGKILVTTNVAHGITINDIICHTGLTDSNYVGFFKVITVPSTTTYTITATWGATGTGFIDRPAYLQVKDIAVGFYNFEWTSTMKIAGSSIKLDFDLHDGTNTIDGSKSGYKFANTTTEKQPGGLGEKILVIGDRIFWTIKNTINSTNVTVEHIKVRGEHI